MNTRDKILQTIYGAVEEINRQLPPEQRLEPRPETVLVGPDAGLDSLGLINLIVTAEQQIQNVLRRPVNLTDGAFLENPEATMSTLGRLADSIAQKTGEASDD